MPACKGCGHELKETTRNTFYCDFRECSFDGAEIEPEIDTNEVIGEFKLPNGHHCIITANKAGGRSYISDEIGGGVLIYDTCLQDQSSVLACLAKETELEIEEWRKKNGKQRGA